MNYDDFLAERIISAPDQGFDPYPMRDCMGGFRGYVAETCIKRGKSAAFLDTGLGKTSVELEFASQCARKTGKQSLILTPLAVARQIEHEAEKFGYDAKVFREYMPDSQIVICNYDRLHHLDAKDFGAVVLDESSILRNFTGKTKILLIEKFKNTPYKLCATATPAPNDHMELGNHSEFLGVMDAQRMLMRWFINDTATASQVWRLKGHAVKSFWNWVSSWAVMAKTPNDLGFDGTDFILPKLTIHNEMVTSGIAMTDGLFHVDTSATGIYATKRQTAETRVAKACEIARQHDNETVVIWCDTDQESAALKSSLGSEYVEVKGSMPPEKKEQALDDFAGGKYRGIITKPSIAGAGLNWQHASTMIFVGRTFSYESWYQAVRRCWRFGQKKEVNVFVIVSEGEDQIKRILDRKGDDHATMQNAMRQAQIVAIADKTVDKKTSHERHEGNLPSWL